MSEEKEIPVDVNAPLRRWAEIGKNEQAEDEALLELLGLMEDHTPIIPDAVTDYYLMKSGVQVEDVRLKRLLALAAQKFIADIATDSMQYYKIRQQNTQSKEKRPIYANNQKKTVLSMEDLTSALRDYGINVQKPEYYP